MRSGKLPKMCEGRRKFSLNSFALYDFPLSHFCLSSFSCAIIYNFVTHKRASHTIDEHSVPQQRRSPASSKTDLESSLVLGKISQFSCHAASSSPSHLQWHLF